MIANVERLMRDVYIPAKKPIYRILDFTAMTQFRLTMLSDGIKTLRNKPSNIAHTALVASSPVANGIANTLAHVLSKQDVVMYRSLDAGRNAVDELLAHENDAVASKGGGAS